MKRVDKKLGSNSGNVLVTVLAGVIACTAIVLALGTVTKVAQGKKQATQSVMTMDDLQKKLEELMNLPYNDPKLAVNTVGSSQEHVEGVFSWQVESIRTGGAVTRLKRIRVYMTGRLEREQVVAVGVKYAEF